MIDEDQAIKNLPDLDRCIEVSVVLLFGKRVTRRCRRPRGPHPKFCATHRNGPAQLWSGKSHYHKIPGLGMPRRSPLRKTLKGA